MQPVDIAHSLSKNALVVTWADGLASELPIPYLRAWCPCAACQGHGTQSGDGIHFLPTPSDITATGIYEMGAYAIGIRFSDGHDSGIFSWTWLRQLAPESEPRGEKRGSFRGGVFRP